MLRKIDEATFGCLLPVIIAVMGLCVTILIVLFTAGVILEMVGVR